jgi:hypothetical protein
MRSGNPPPSLRSCTSKALDDKDQPIGRDTWRRPSERTWRVRERVVYRLVRVPCGLLCASMLMTRAGWPVLIPDMRSGRSETFLSLRAGRLEGAGRGEEEEESSKLLNRSIFLYVAWMDRAPHASNRTIQNHGAESRRVRTDPRSRTGQYYAGSLVIGMSKANDERISIAYSDEILTWTVVG